MFVGVCKDFSFFKLILIIMRENTGTNEGGSERGRESQTGYVLSLLSPRNGEIIHDLRANQESAT